jgi:hypothetical protein
MIQCRKIDEKYGMFTFDALLFIFHTAKLDDAPNHYEVGYFL